MDPAFTWDHPKPAASRRRADSGGPPPPRARERISLREAEHRFGVAVATLRTWARKHTIDATMAEVDGLRQWMVTPESVAHHLSRTPSKTTRQSTGRKPSGRPATGPTGDGTAMLVPRDAWDRLIDQLGNLHETGLMLAEARERAARAETEAGFLRERLAEMRLERDESRQRAAAAAEPVPAAPRRRFFGRGR